MEDVQNFVLTVTLGTAFFVGTAGVFLTATTFGFGIGFAVTALLNVTEAGFTVEDDAGINAAVDLVTTLTVPSVWI